MDRVALAASIWQRAPPHLVRHLQRLADEVLRLSERITSRHLDACSRSDSAAGSIDAERNAHRCVGATVLHLHVRDPKTGRGSKNFHEFNEQIARLRKAVPKMIIQVGGSILFAPADDHQKAQWLGYDTRHMLTELNPKPDQVTIVVGTTQMDILPLTTPDDVQGTQLATRRCRPRIRTWSLTARPSSI
jgi:beta-keto acid cleavage enzyme